MASQSRKQLDKNGEMEISRIWFVETYFSGTHLFDAVRQPRVRPDIKEEPGYGRSSP